MTKEQLKWEKWHDSLTVFEGWLKEDHGALARSWWAYLYSLLLGEIATLSPSSGICLDVGCGGGWHLSGVIRNSYFEGIGLDPLKSSLKQFRDNAKRGSLYKKISLIQGVGEYLPIREDCIQLCYIAGSLDHVSSTKQTIGEFRRVLEPQGNLIVLETALLRKGKGFYDDTHVSQFTSETLKATLKGFNIKKSLKKVPVFSQLFLPDRLLDFSLIHQMLGRLPGTIGVYFNYSEIVIECKKTPSNTKKRM